MASMPVSVEEASVWPVVAPFTRYAEAGIPQYRIIDPARVEVYDLDDAGEYTLTASTEGDAELTIAGPLAVTVTPTALVAD